MDFDATPHNIIILLVVVLAVIALTYLLRGRYDSNMPLMYYSAAVMVASFSEHGLHPYLLMVGISLSMVLRFEFMSTGVTKVFGVLTTISVAVTMFGLLNQVFGNGRMSL
jgi:hypothetical protein